jgi:glycosyltransferase involved in cell wall biosynthesis
MLCPLGLNTPLPGVNATMAPFVTVLIPAYNAETTIERAIDSALAQNYPAFEIIVVDDGSRDMTSEVVTRYERSEVRLLRLPYNHGEGGVLNEGIAVSKGEFIAFLDADDEWLATKLAKQVELLERNPRASMATCGCLFSDRDGQNIQRFGMPPMGFGKNEIWRRLLAATCIAKPCVLVRASVLAEVGLFDTTVPIAADQDMWIRLAMAGDVEFVSEYLVVAHDTPGSLTKTYVTQMDRAVLPMVHRYLQQCRAVLTSREIRGILCERYVSTGRNLYVNGRALRGLCLILRSLMLGGRSGEALWYLASASPPGRAIKRLIRRELPAEPLRGSLKRFASLLAPNNSDLAGLPAGPPILITIVDAEEEIDRSGPYLRTHLSARNSSKQALVQDIFDRFGVKPTYFVDYAVATQREGYEPLREIADSGRCEIGAHLKSWETPPFEEELGDRTSYNHNLPAWLQKEKLLRLTEMIVSNFAIQPSVYRAGRNGVGEEIAWIMEALGYRIDMSVLPGIDMRRWHGPDFRKVPDSPYWFGRDKTLLEIPNTATFTGVLSSAAVPKGLASQFYYSLTRPSPLKARTLGLVSHLGLLERIVLTPEGATVTELRRLTRALLSRGRRVFVFHYRSSSLLPGVTDYIRSAQDLSCLLATIESYFRFFFRELDGVAMTPGELHAEFLGCTAAVPRTGPMAGQ